MRYNDSIRSNVEVEGPMAVVILGGLVGSMALNLLVLPTLALCYGRFEGRRRRSWHRRIVDICLLDARSAIPGLSPGLKFPENRENNRESLDFSLVGTGYLLR